MVLNKTAKLSFSGLKKNLLTRRFLLPCLILTLMTAAPSTAQYHPFDTTLALVQTLVSAHPSIIAKHSFGVSVEGRELFAVKISDNVGVNETEPEVGFDGGTHGNEIPGQEMVILLMQELCQGYGVDTQITRYVNTREIWIYPHVNPDGRVRNTRANAKGVNINRDWGYMWDGAEGSAAPFSQPETRACGRWFLQNHFCASQSNHDGVEMVLFPWADRPLKPAEWSLFNTLASVYASFTGYRYGNLYSTLYPATGVSEDFFYGSRGALGWIVEVSNNKDPGAAAIPAMYAKNRLGMLYLIEQAGRGIWGTVTDSATGRPLAASIWVTRDTIESFPCYNDPEAGDYHKILLPGAYSVTAFANGYRARTVTGVTVSDTGARRLNFVLAPSADANLYGQQVLFCRVPGISSSNPFEYRDEALTPRALIKPDNRNYSVGKDGFVVIDLGDTMYDRTGPDLRILEGGVTDEGYSVRVSLDLWDSLPRWRALGRGFGSASFDLADSGVTGFRYIYLRDDNDDEDRFADNAGFDFDAVMALRTPDGTPPAPPLLLTALSFGPRAVRLAWSPSVELESGVARYLVYRDGAPAGMTTDTALTDSGLLDDTRYAYSVKAENIMGLMSGFSNTLEAVTGLDTVRPFPVSIRTDFGSARIELTFSEPVDAASAEDPSNYSISGGLRIDSVTRTLDPRRVNLDLIDTMADGSALTLTLNHIKDLARSPNTVPVNSAIHFTYVSGLVLHLALNEAGGDTAFDQTAFSNHGLLVNGPIRSDGVVGRALMLDTMNYVQVADDSSLKFGTRDFSLALWVRFDSLIRKQVILDKTDGSTGFRLMLSDTDADRLKLIRGATFAEGVLSSDASVTARTWTHIAASVRNDTAHFYVNGLFRGAVKTQPNSTNCATPLYAGRKGYAGSTALPFKGAMDEIRIYNRALTPGEIARLADSTGSLIVSTSFPIDPVFRVTASPNPFNGSTRMVVRYGTAGLVKTKVEFKIFDISGRMVGDLSFLEQSPSPQRVRTVRWNADASPSGVYFAKIRINGAVIEKRLVLVK